MSNKVLVREDEYSQLVDVTSHMTDAMVMVNIALWYVKKMSLRPFYMLKIVCLEMLQKVCNTFKMCNYRHCWNAQGVFSGG